MNLIREVMIRNVQISFVTNVKFDFKARSTQMGRPYPAQYLGRGVLGSELKQPLKMKLWVSVRPSYLNGLRS